MQHLLTPGPLLNEEGDLVEAGYAFSLVKHYSREAIKAPKLRIKEWDYYYVGNQHVGVALTVADNSYMSLAGATVFDFNRPFQKTKNVMGLLSRGKILMPSSSASGDVIFNTEDFSFHFTHENGRRHLVCEMKNFDGEKPFRCDIYLEETVVDSMVIATPFNKPKHFYYNQKINLLKANGYAKVGDDTYDLSLDSWGVLDWGRGVWTYKNTWYWSSMSGVYKGKKIGFNLGYGFGETGAASENMFFYDGKAYKLEDVKFDIPIADNGDDDYMKPWKFRSKTGDIALTFEPLLDRYSNSNVLVIKSVQHQVFGKFTGCVVIEGKQVYFEEMLGFAEKVKNCW
ncbi:MAG: DUF2804 domain-containing protein [Bacilli bacterium]|jgi:hypothetical protein